MNDEKQKDFLEIANKYGVAENDKFIVIDESGCPLFKSSCVYEGGIFREYLPGGLSYDVDIDILRKVLKIYHASLKVVKEG